MAVIRLATATLRWMENWRQLAGDYDSAMIVVAIIAISADRLTRGEGLQGPLRDLRTPLLPGMTGPCNISSIASATGLNRETTRRRIGELERAGLVIRGRDGNVGFVSGLPQAPRTLDVVIRQLQTMARVTNDLVRDGSIKIDAHRSESVVRAPAGGD
jgi:DNA-binding transcriptional ArsR family regulator